MLVKFFVLVGLVCLLSGCEAMQSLSNSMGGVLDTFLEEDNAEPPKELSEYEAEIKSKILWQQNIGVGSEGMYLKLEPLVVDGRLFVADRAGLVQSRNLENGEMIWETETETQISAGPGFGNDKLFVGTSNAEILALSLEDGAVLWTQKVSSEILAVPKSAGNIVVSRGVDGRLNGLDGNGGDILWTYERTVPPLSLRGTADPLLENGFVIEGYASGKLVALRLSDGKVEWESSVIMPEGRSELERLVDLDADPLIMDDVIFLGSFQGGVFAISTHDGRMIWWRREISVYSAIAGDWNYLYVSDENSDVWALEQRNGASLWKQTELHQRRLTAPAVYKDWIVVGDFEGYVHWLSQYDGRQMGRLKVSDSAIVTRPVVVDDVLYVYAKDGTLAALVAK